MSLIRRFICSIIPLVIIPPALDLIFLNEFSINLNKDSKESSSLTYLRTLLSSIRSLFNLNSSLLRYSGSSKSAPLYLSEYSSKNLEKTSPIKETYLSSSLSPSTLKVSIPLSRIKFITSIRVSPRKSLGLFSLCFMLLSLTIWVKTGSTILARTGSDSLFGSPNLNTIPSTSLSRSSLRAVFLRSGFSVPMINLTKLCVLNLSTS